MRIVADADILSVQECFSRLGQLELVEGRKINNKLLQEADALLVRSITRVDETLLANSKIQFVGTATSGIDHIDTDYLRTRKIQFCHAQGCNAIAVTEYCLAALALLSRERGLTFKGRQFALIGVGQVGGLLATRLCELGMQCVAYDPLLNESRRMELQRIGVEFVEYDEALQAQIISYHVPLVRGGEFPTFHQLAAAELRNLPRDCVLINAARGPVVSNTDLKQVLMERDDLAVILDVWEGEPYPDPLLLDLVFLGTPHIAGYSVESKRRATNRLLEQFCEHFAVQYIVQDAVSAEDSQCQLTLAAQSLDRQDEFCSGLILEAFPVDQTGMRLREEIASFKRGQISPFDSLRRELSSRREFSAYQIEDLNLSNEQRRFLQLLGFQFN